MTVSRRRLLAACGSGIGALAAGTLSTAVVVADEPGAPADAAALLYDATLCIGCRACVVGCSRVNDNDPDRGDSGGLHLAPRDLNSRTRNIIKLSRNADGTESSFIKRQCMHCLDPACVAGCPFGALQKGDRGIVAWEPDRCIGCRYCEVACPFGIPKFEWDKFNPRIVKCEMCRHLLDEQEQPECTRVCPTGSVIFGEREELLAEAHARIASNPGRYFEDRVYGETEGGGLQSLCLSHVPFTDLGLPDLGPESLPESRSWVKNASTRWGIFPMVAFAGMALLTRRHWQRHEEEARSQEAAGGPEDQL